MLCGLGMSKGKAVISLLCQVTYRTVTYMYILIVHKKIELFDSDGNLLVVLVS